MGGFLGYWVVPRSIWGHHGGSWGHPGGACRHPKAFGGRCGGTGWSLGRFGGSLGAFGGHPGLAVGLWLFGGGSVFTPLWGTAPTFLPSHPPPAAQAPLKPKTPRGTKTPINRNQLSQSRGLAGLVGKRGYEGGAEGHRPPRVRVRTPR